MKPEELITSLYLGDRSCGGIFIDTRKRRVSIQVDLISRLKPGTKTWNFNSDGDIPDGRIVFTEAHSIRLDPSGLVPNDFITDLTVKPSDSGSQYIFELSAGSVDETGHSTEVLIRIEAKGVHLEDPRRPGVEIY